MRAVEAKRFWLSQLAEDADDFRSTSPTTVAEEMAAVLSAHFALVVSEILDSIANPLERWERLREILPEPARLRREDHQAQLTEDRHRRTERLEAEAQARIRLAGAITAGILPASPPPAANLPSRSST